MSNKISTVHWSFWVITTFMMIWNLMGCINFCMQMVPEIVASYRESEQAIIENRPLWATTAFAFAVFGGALGCLMLFLKHNSAFYIFIISFLGVIVTMGHTLSLGLEFGVGEIIGIIILPIVISAFLIWYAKYAEKKGWLST